MLHNNSESLEFTISTDIIVGFPTETEEDFQMTMQPIEETRPDIGNLSRYSPNQEQTLQKCHKSIWWK